MLSTRSYRSCSPAAAETRAFDALLQSMVHGFPGFQAARSSAPVRAFPAVNAWEDGDQFHLEAELPGFEISDIDISLVDKQLTLSGESKGVGVEEGTYLRRERRGGKFTRTLRLASEIDADRISATLKDGVLHVTLPKAPSAKPRKIAVTSA